MILSFMHGLGPHPVWPQLYSSASLWRDATAACAVALRICWSLRRLVVTSLKRHVAALRAADWLAPSDVPDAHTRTTKRETPTVVLPSDVRLPHKEEVVHLFVQAYLEPLHTCPPTENVDVLAGACIDLDSSPVEVPLMSARARLLPKGLWMPAEREAPTTSELSDPEKYRVWEREWTTRKAEAAGMGRSAMSASANAPHGRYRFVPRGMLFATTKGVGARPTSLM